MKKQIPVLFSTTMVQELPPAGNKTMTRRLRGLNEVNEAPEDWEYVRFHNGFAKFCEKHNWTNEKYLKCPYGQPGDLLWVRETFTAFGYYEGCREVHIRYNDGVQCGVTLGWTAWQKYEKWQRKLGKHPSLFMFQEMARIWLEVVSVRVERLQDITEADAQAEGVLRTFAPADGCLYANYLSKTNGKYDAHLLNARLSFTSLWISINGRESWDSNPWVWVVEFKKAEKP